MLLNNLTLLQTRLASNIISIHLPKGISMYKCRLNREYHLGIVNSANDYKNWHAVPTA